MALEKCQLVLISVAGISFDTGGFLKNVFVYLLLGKGCDNEIFPAAFFDFQLSFDGNWVAIDNMEMDIADFGRNEVQNPLACQNCELN